MINWLTNIEQILEDILTGTAIDSNDIHQALLDIQTFKNQIIFENKNVFTKFKKKLNKFGLPTDGND